jgi:DNA-directed RNA polymerase subunit alpha
MLKFRNFGKKSLEEIIIKLKKYDLELGMDVDGIYRKIREAKSRGIRAEDEVAVSDDVQEEVVPPRKPVPPSKKKVKNAT